MGLNGQAVFKLPESGDILYAMKIGLWDDRSR